MISYRKSKTFEERLTESNKIFAKYPSSIPVIIETYDPLIKKCIKKYKFLVPENVSASHLLCSIRRQFDLSPSKAIFLFCDNILVNGTIMMSELYNKYKEKHKKSNDFDKFLYITISTENTFG